LFQADKELSFNRKTFCDKRMIVLVLPQEEKAVLEVFYLFSSTQLVEIVIWLVKWVKTTI